jgi:hypothetical protein
MFGDKELGGGWHVVGDQLQRSNVVTQFLLTSWVDVLLSMEIWLWMM